MGSAFASAGVPRKKGYFAGNVTIQISSNLHSICLWVPSMCVVNLRMKVGRYLRELGMPPLTMQEEGLTKGTSCPSHCPMLGAS